ncbi:hypothetical protein LINGRAHAP2_LOCUS7884 [Linum grandiflorum]
MSASGGLAPTTHGALSIRMVAWLSHQRIGRQRVRLFEMLKDKCLLLLQLN